MIFRHSFKILNTKFIKITISNNNILHSTSGSRKVAARHAKLVEKNPKKAKQAVLALRSEPRRGKARAPRRDASTYMDSLRGTAQDRRTLAAKDKLVHWNEFDFCERYEGLGRSPEKAQALWLLARAGNNPPWTPTRSRGQDSVAKLDPEVVEASRGKVLSGDKRKLRAGVDVLATKLRKVAPGVDGVELLPDFSTAPPPLPSRSGASVAPSSGTKLSRPLGGGVAAEEEEGPPSKRRRSLPGTCGGSTGQVDPRGQATPVASRQRGVHAALAIGGDGADSARGSTPRGRPAALPPPPSEEDLTAKMEMLPDILDDPLQFGIAIKTWKQLGGVALAKQKVVFSKSYKTCFKEVDSYVFV